MAEKQLMTLLLADGDGGGEEMITILIMSSEEFDAFCDELQAIAEEHRFPQTDWQNREALTSARRRRNINQLVRRPWTEDLFVKHGIETAYLDAFDNEHSLARNVILAARYSANRYDAYLEIMG
jgi:hypothetical protein